MKWYDKVPNEVFGNKPQPQPKSHFDQGFGVPGRNAPAAPYIPSRQPPPQGLQRQTQIGYTGAGPSGIARPNMPVAMIPAAGGQNIMLHEGEGVVQGRDGRTTVVPKNQLDEIGKRSGAIGMATGGSFPTNSFGLIDANAIANPTQKTQAINQNVGLMSSTGKTVAQLGGDVGPINAQTYQVMYPKATAPAPTISDVNAPVVAPQQMMIAPRRTAPTITDTVNAPIVQAQPTQTFMAPTRSRPTGVEDVYVQAPPKFYNYVGEAFDTQAEADESDRIASEGDGNVEQLYDPSGASYGGENAQPQKFYNYIGEAFDTQAEADESDRIQSEGTGDVEQLYDPSGASYGGDTGAIGGGAPAEDYTSGTNAGGGTGAGGAAGAGYFTNLGTTNIVPENRQTYEAPTVAGQSDIEKGMQFYRDVISGKSPMTESLYNQMVSKFGGASAAAIGAARQAAAQQGLRPESIGAAGRRATMQVEGETSKAMSDVAAKNAEQMSGAAGSLVTTAQGERTFGQTQKDSEWQRTLLYNDPTTEQGLKVLQEAYGKIYGGTVPDFNVLTEQRKYALAKQQQDVTGGEQTIQLGSQKITMGQLEIESKQYGLSTDKYKDAIDFINKGMTSAADVNAATGLNLTQEQVNSMAVKYTQSVTLGNQSVTLGQINIDSQNLGLTTDKFKAAVEVIMNGGSLADAQKIAGPNFTKANYDSVHQKYTVGVDTANLQLQQLSGKVESDKFDAVMEAINNGITDAATLNATYKTNYSQEEVTAMGRKYTIGMAVAQQGLTDMKTKAGNDVWDAFVKTIKDGVTDVNKLKSDPRFATIKDQITDASVKAISSKSNEELNRSAWADALQMYDPDTVEGKAGLTAAWQKLHPDQAVPDFASSAFAVERRSSIETSRNTAIAASGKNAAAFVADIVDNNTGKSDAEVVTIAQGNTNLREAIKTYLGGNPTKAEIDSEIENRINTAVKGDVDIIVDGFIKNGRVPKDYMDNMTQPGGKEELRRTVQDMLNSGAIDKNGNFVGTADANSTTWPWNNSKYFNNYVDWNGNDINYAAGGKTAKGWTETAVDDTGNYSAANKDTASYYVVDSKTKAKRAVNFHDMEIKWNNLSLSDQSKYFADGKFDRAKFLTDNFGAVATAGSDGSGAIGSVNTPAGTTGSYVAHPDGNSVVNFFNTTDGQKVQDNIINNISGQPITDANGKTIGESKPFMSDADEIGLDGKPVALSTNNKYQYFDESGVVHYGKVSDVNMQTIWQQFSEYYNKGVPMTSQQFMARWQDGEGWYIGKDGTVTNFTKKFQTDNNVRGQNVQIKGKYQIPGTPVRAEIVDVYNNPSKYTADQRKIADKWLSDNGYTLQNLPGRKYSTEIDLGTTGSPISKTDLDAKMVTGIGSAGTSPTYANPGWKDTDAKNFVAMYPSLQKNENPNITTDNLDQTWQPDVIDQWVKTNLGKYTVYNGKPYMVVGVTTRNPERGWNHYDDNRWDFVRLLDPTTGTTINSFRYRND